MSWLLKKNNPPTNYSIVGGYGDNGAAGQNRTVDPTLLTTSVSALWSGLSLDLIMKDLGPARLVSTPSLALGLARDCLGYKL